MMKGKKRSNKIAPWQRDIHNLRGRSHAWANEWSEPHRLQEQQRSDGKCWTKKRVQQKARNTYELCSSAKTERRRKWRSTRANS